MATPPPLIPGSVYTLLHLVEFGARMGGDSPDAEALKKIEPTLEAAARGVQMLWPAIAATIALIEAHIKKGAAPDEAVGLSRDHIQAAPVVMLDPQQDAGR